MPTLDPRDIDMTYSNVSTGTIKMSSPNTVVAPGDSYQFRDNNAYQNSLSFHALGKEMLRVSPDGFYVRGVRLDQDDAEAQIVYNSFKEWLTWQQLNRG